MEKEALLTRFEREVTNSYLYPKQLLCNFMVEWFRLWLYAHRLAMDHLVAFLILILLLPGMLLDNLNDCVLPTVNFHNLLVYRDFEVPTQITEDAAGPVQLGSRTEERVP